MQTKNTEEIQELIDQMEQDALAVTKSLCEFHNKWSKIGEEVEPYLTGEQRRQLESLNEEIEEMFRVTGDER